MGVTNHLLTGTILQVYARCIQLKTPLAFRLKFLSHELIHRQIPAKYLEEAFDRVVVGVGPKGKSVAGLRDITRNPHCLPLIVSPTIMEAKTNPVLETKFFQVYLFSTSI